MVTVIGKHTERFYIYLTLPLAFCNLFFFSSYPLYRHSKVIPMGTMTVIPMGTMTVIPMGTMTIIAMEIAAMMVTIRTKVVNVKKLRIMKVNRDAMMVTIEARMVIVNLQEINLSVNQLK